MSHRPRCRTPLQQQVLGCWSITRLDQGNSSTCRIFLVSGILLASHPLASPRAGGFEGIIQHLLRDPHPTEPGCLGVDQFACVKPCSSPHLQGWMEMEQSPLPRAPCWPWPPPTCWCSDQSTESEAGVVLWSVGVQESSGTNSFSQVQRGSFTSHAVYWHEGREGGRWGPKHLAERGHPQGPLPHTPQEKPDLGTWLEVQVHGQEDTASFSFLLLSLSTSGPL